MLLFFCFQILFYFSILYWFCHIFTWIHHRCTWVPQPWTPLPPPSPYHLFGSSQCTSPKHPVSCIEPRLAIRFLYDIIHVSVVVLEKTLESPLDCKEIQLVHPKGNQFWIFIERTDTEAETPILWPPHAKSWLIGKDPDAGRGWGQEEKGTIEDEMVEWHHRLDGHEFEQAPGVGDGQGSLACCSPCSCQELDRTERLNWIYRFPVLNNLTVADFSSNLMSHRLIKRATSGEKNYGIRFSVRH